MTDPRKSPPEIDDTEADYILEQYGEDEEPEIGLDEDSAERIPF